MSEWKEYKLNDISTIVDCEHKTAPTVENSEFISVRTSNISNGKIDFDNCNRVSEKTYTDWSKRMGLVEGDIVLAREAPVGEVGWIPKNKKVCLGQRTVLIRADKQKIDSKYLLFFLVSNETKYDLISRSTGSVVEHLNVKDIKNFEIKVRSSVDEQRAIASILSSLDDKIDLLHRQNKTLEQLAETLFRQWFVVEESKNSEIKCLGDFVDATLGGEWGKENEEGDYTFKVQCIRGTDIADLETGIADRAPIRFIKPTKFGSIEMKDGDLVMEISGGSDDQSTGRAVYINDDVKALFNYPLIFSNFCRLIRPKKKEYSFFLFSYIHLLYKQGDLFNLENGSSGIRNLDYKALLYQLKFKLLPEKEVEKFNGDIALYFSKVNKNKFQIRTLTQLRDTLLPKLMSGEVRVKKE